MITRYRAKLDGRQLDSLGDSVYIVDIYETAPVYAANYADVIGAGRRLVSHEMESRRVSVSFMVRSPDPVERQRIMDHVRAWCLGERLEISSRPGKHLLVHADTLPDVSALRWTDTVTVEFTTAATPEWINNSPAVVTIPAAASSASLFCPGTAAAAPCEIVAANKGTATVNDLTITTEKSAFVFEALDLKRGETLHISHNTAGLLRITITSADNVQTRSAYGKRTAESSDELLIPCGKSSTITKNGAVELRVMARGRYI